ncbi:microsomal glutathione S-transferase 1-like [Sabethes cyaneus]|uniref:microsomal glutathione S-transferase 1-like n=1 Tax=Sabethes cyaneus TaxID=53552 RepID=UPI00237DA77C|nr:microsomal glutathione S-transferase 1-like [Sabethes cyaneus]
MEGILANLDADLFRTYAFWCALLALKMLGVGLLTSMTRIRKRAACERNNAHFLRNFIAPDFGLSECQNKCGADNEIIATVFAFPSVHLGPVYVSREDAAFMNAKWKRQYDPHVERVRRAHRNDLENLLPFYLLAFLYLLTGPNPTLAGRLIRWSSISRIIHSIVYACFVVPQPARVLSYAVMQLSMAYMSYKCMSFFL